MGKSLFYSLLLATMLGGLFACSKESLIPADTGGPDDENVTNNENNNNNNVDPKGEGPIAGGTYYVAPWGSDDSTGTFKSPWGSWQKAFTSAKAGDTVYFRGGVYKLTKSSYGNNITMIMPNGKIGHSGTAKNPVCFYNYPGEIPILDCSLIKTSGNFNTGINIDGASFIKFRGLTISNIVQNGANVAVCGVNCYQCSNLTFENIVVHDLGGRGFYFESGAWKADVPYDTTRWINCDVYNCVDKLGEAPGNMADGWKTHGYVKTYLSWKGCRAWKCSDDGFDASGPGIAVWDNCWAFDIGNYCTGNGNGFKLTSTADSVSYITRIVTHCIAAHCTTVNGVGSGFEQIEYGGYYRIMSRYYNNIAYNNDMGFSVDDNPSKPWRFSTYRNNISYKNTKLNPCNVKLNVSMMNYKYEESNNTWDWINPSPASCPPWFTDAKDVSLDDNDFVSLDINELASDRDSDGSLPDVNCFHLAAGSDLIDAGTQIPSSDRVNLVLKYKGSAPDIGPFER